MPDADFRGLYDLYADMVYNLALHYTRNVQDAEEITQDVFVKVHRKLHAFRKEAQAKTWIYRIAVNTSLDFLKAQKTVRRTGLLRMLRFEDISPPAIATESPSSAIESSEAVEALFRAIRKLPEKQQTALILVKIEGLSKSEAAEIMELSVKAVESLVQRGKQHLQNILNKTQENG